LLTIELVDDETWLLNADADEDEDGTSKKTACTDDSGVTSENGRSSRSAIEFDACNAWLNSWHDDKFEPNTDV